VANLRVLHAVDGYAVQLRRVSLHVETINELLVDDVIAELDAPRDFQTEVGTVAEQGSLELTDRQFSLHQDVAVGVSDHRVRREVGEVLV